MKEFVGKRVEEVILISIILLQILDFLGLLSPDIDFIKKALSVAAIIYIFYRINIPKVVFGENNKSHNLILLFIVIIYQMKSVVAYLSEMGSKLDQFQIVNYLMQIYPKDQITNNSYLLDHCFILASILLISFCIYLSFRVDYKENSLMYALTKEKFNESRFKFFLNFILNYFVLGIVMLFVFNPIIEWLAWSIDAPLLIAGIFFYFVFTTRFGRESTIYKLGNLGESFIIKFFNLFKDRNTIYLGVMGLIGLHLIVDIGNFIVPYLTSGVLVLEYNSFYLKTLGVGHEPLINLFLEQSGNIQDVGLFGFMSRLSLIGLYLGNIIAILISLIVPAVIWYALYKKRRVNLSRSFLGIIFSSFVCLLFAPLFKITYIDPNSGLVGVDILTQQINNSIFLFFMAVLVFIFVYMASNYDKLKRFFLNIGLISYLIFLGVYVAYFYYSLFWFYGANITQLMLIESIKNYFIAGILISFFCMTSLFYFSGYFEFVKNVKNEVRYFK